jgi:hypothetical protein
MSFLLNIEAYKNAYKTSNEGLYHFFSVSRIDIFSSHATRIPGVPLCTARVDGVSWVKYFSCIKIYVFIYVENTHRSYLSAGYLSSLHI